MTNYIDSGASGGTQLSELADITISTEEGAAAMKSLQSDQVAAEEAVETVDGV